MMNYILARTAYLHSNDKYGKRWLLCWGKLAGPVLAMMCLVTPGTNWALPFTFRVMKKKTWVNQK